MTRRLVAVVLAAGALLALLHNRQEPVSPHEAGPQSAACTSCHAVDAPRVHAEEFVTRGHGPSARLNAGSCAACHGQASCDECHGRSTSAPESHTALFKTVRGAGRAQHVREARARPESCAACHAQRQGATCGRCHAPGMEVGR